MQDQTTSDAEVAALLARAVEHHGGARWPEAERLYREILAARPADARTAHNLGGLYLLMDRPADAARLLEQAVAHNPTQGPSWIAWIDALSRAGRHAAAAQVLEDFIAKGAGAHANAPGAELFVAWGLALAAQGRLEESAERFGRALTFDPAGADAMSNLAGTLQRLNRHAEAEALYRRLLALHPDHVPALRNFGVLLKDRSAWAEAQVCYRRAAALDGDLDVSIQAHLALSPIVQSVADLEAQRAGYAAGLEAFAADPRTFGYGGGRLNLPWFYLAYHGRGDRDLMVRTAEVLADEVPGLRHVSPRLADWRPPADAGRKTRVVFCSEFLTDHTIGRLYAGLIRRLDRTRFEVAIAHGPYAGDDAFRATLDADVQAVTLSADLARQRAEIEALAPDALIFPDIGMSAQSYFLAQSRLAPVQAASWGHPNTTGLPTIDYFLSAEAIEPDGAEAAYAERLIRFGRLPCFYEPPEASAPGLSRAACGLPADGVLYGCPQTLFKLHPDFDTVLAEIAQSDPTGHIVLIGAQNQAWTEALRARWAATHPILLDRAVFLPRMSPREFVAHLALIDVLLDPLHFGSGNTLYEAMGEGTPIVTCPGAFARSRIVAGAYAQMGVADAPVAASHAAYAPLALALGRDPGRRAALRAALKAAARDQLFADQAAVTDFEAFLDAAVAAAGRGEHLPTGWRPIETAGAS